MWNINTQAPPHGILKKHAGKGEHSKGVHDQTLFPWHQEVCDELRLFGNLQGILNHPAKRIHATEWICIIH